MKSIKKKLDTFIFIISLNLHKAPKATEPKTKTNQWDLIKQASTAKETIKITKRLNSKLNDTEEQISDLEDKAVEITAAK